MLQITVPGGELWSEEREIFTYSKEAHLKLEHSLISISNWETIWHIPYFDAHLTDEQALSYIRCMTLNKEVDPEVYYRLTYDNLKQIHDYMSDSMTASTVGRLNNQITKPGSKPKRITSELIYYWMIQFQIPFTCERWHINRLIMLIEICAEENRPKDKKHSKSTKQLAAEYRAINAANRAKFNTKG